MSSSYISLFVSICFAAWSTALAQDATMIRIPGGTFMMGSNTGEKDESPSHRVAVADFYLDKTVVTNAQYADYLNKVGGPKTGPGATPHFDLDDRDVKIQQTADGRFAPQSGHENRPVLEVSWYGARAYCEFFNKRLPTEAEWEFAARGTAGRIYPWGNAKPDSSRAQFGRRWGSTADVSAHPAGATPEGILGLAGNVHEWTSSAYTPYPYRADGREDPDATVERVTRGGAHDTSAPTLIATWRGRNVSREPDSGHHNVGFRCARS